jgi:cell division cycle protein 20 (cofactor of APC complex)
MSAQLVETTPCRKSFRSPTLSRAASNCPEAHYQHEPRVNRYIRSRRDPPTDNQDPTDAQSAGWNQRQPCTFLNGSDPLPLSPEANERVCSYRSLPSQPERILDAPDILDDYYLNLLDWSSLNQLAVALRNRLYIWDAHTGDVSQLMESSGTITSLAWSSDGQTLAIGDSDSCISLYDVNTGRSYRSFLSHRDRVSSLAWNGSVLSSGSRDASIVQHDVRADRYFMRMAGHEQEVCGLKWSGDGSQLASGGNDNLMCIWEAMNAVPRFRSGEHKAAVKALAWCPWKPNLLASGGGTADKTIKLWNTATCSCVQSIGTGSQVCALEWNRHARELLSAHGYAQNQLSLWSYPDLVKVAEFTGHSSRVLFMAQNPEGSSVVSAGADETLRFWRVFESSLKPQCKLPSDSDDFQFQCR